MLFIMAASFGVCFIIKDFVTISENVITVFVFAVFVISLVTDGYIWGVIATVIGVFAVNFAFLFPYFSFNFTMPENLLSAIVMLVVSLMTSTMTTKLKRSETLKAEGEREKMRANLLRAVSHDLRTPLTTIYGASSAMLESYDALTDLQKTKMIGGIKEDSEWLIRMVENLLSITRVDEGRVKLIKTPTVLEELIDSVVIKFRKRYPKEGVKIEIPEDMIIIPMDAILIEQVLVNLLENAVQHAKGMTELSLSVAKREDEVIFSVADNGEGLDEDRIPEIFRGYYKTAEKTADSNRKNAGIGLSVCAAIIKAHGGTISAANAKGGGAVFSFTLSAKEDASVEQQIQNTDS